MIWYGDRKPALRSPFWLDSKKGAESRSEAVVMFAARLNPSYLTQMEEV